MSAFTSLDEVVYRCDLRANEVQTLAHLGAFGGLGMTRREALWQASAILTEPLFRNLLTPILRPSPLPRMSALDETLADYRGSGLTASAHIATYMRAQWQEAGVQPAAALRTIANGKWTKIAGLVIVRQRPGTAKGMCFITLEDETGTSNAALRPDVFAHYRGVIHTAALLEIEGPLQKVDGVIHVLARRLREVQLPQQKITQRGSGYRMRTTPEDAPPLPRSHDFR